MDKSIGFIPKATRIVRLRLLARTNIHSPATSSLTTQCLTCQHSRTFASRSLQKARPAPKARQRVVVSSPIPNPRPQGRGPTDSMSGVVSTDFTAAAFQEVLDNDVAPYPDISPEELERRAALFVDGIRNFEPLAIMNRLTLSAVPALTAKELHELALSCEFLPQKGFKVTPAGLEICARSGYGPSVLSSLWVRLQAKQSELPSTHVTRLEQMVREEVPDAQVILAMIYLRKKQPSQAQTLLQRALQSRAGEDVTFELRDYARCALAEVYIAQGDRAKASEVIDELKDINTTDPRLFSMMSKLLHKSDLQQAKKYAFARALRRLTSPDPTHYLAELELDAAESTQDEKLKKMHQLWADEWVELAEDSKRTARERADEKSASPTVEA